jgi:hypothetical protein
MVNDPLPRMSSAERLVSNIRRFRRAGAPLRVELMIAKRDLSDCLKI